MFALLTQQWELITLGPDLRLYVAYSQEEQSAQVFAGPWLVHSFGDGTEPKHRSGLARGLVEDIFKAIASGQTAFDVADYVASR
jgi:hypothetical protein